MDEIEGHIEIEYCAKSEFQAEMRREDEAKAQAEKWEAVKNHRLVLMDFVFNASVVVDKVQNRHWKYYYVAKNA